ncbi:MAG: carbamoyl-phosphate synthase large subunit, partial [Endomicrobia bacterium]|nr:carbamoyl-phosphate synthase large subunit [Endomicrobiia bacterium]
GRTFKEALQKAIRGLEVGRSGLGADGHAGDAEIEAYYDDGGTLRQKAIDEVKYKLGTPNCDRVYFIRLAMRFGMSLDEIYDMTKIDKWFLNQMKEIADFENELSGIFNHNDAAKRKELLFKAKQYGFSDKQIANMSRKSAEEVRDLRKKLGIIPSYKLVDTCGGEFKAKTAYYYSTYESEDEVPVSTNSKKVMILGAGPNRIGQGIEFDYCCVHGVLAFKEEGYETIMVNSNPETVSTDYDTSDRLYFEPLTVEDVLNIADKEKPAGVVVQFGGQTPLNLAGDLGKAGLKILGTSIESIDLAEDRKLFSKVLEKLNIPQAQSGTAISYKEAKKVAEGIGYPVMVRPSYVLGGRAMEIVYDETALESYISKAANVSPGKPILIDKFLDHAVEVDVDALCDGKDVYIAGIMEHIEEAGIHSGDSACVLPSNTLSKQTLETIRKHTINLAREINVKGLMNIQFAVKDEVVYILEANPRASRTTPYVSKATNIPLAKLAAKIMAGKKLSELLPKELLNGPSKAIKYSTVKEVVLPWSRFANVDTVLGPEMKSTGEVMGIDADFGRAFAKAELASGLLLPDSGAVLVSIGPKGKEEALPAVKEFAELGFEIFATKHTAEFFNERGVAAKEVAKIAEGRPNIVDIITNKQVSFIINTPSGAKSHKDGYQIRRNAVMYGIPIVTTIAAAKASLQGIKAKKKGDWAVAPLQEYYKNDRVKSGE